MSNSSAKPRILFVTPEVSIVPAPFGENAGYLNTKSDGMGGIISDLLVDLYEQGADVHITQPDYRGIFSAISRNSPPLKARLLPNSLVHLTEDRAFFYASRPKLNDQWENNRISVAFQREVINHVLPLVQPDLIHCHGWMTGLIPAMAKSLEIPCIFSFHDLETGKVPLSEIEDLGIDAAAFWQHLFFERFPVNYEETREINSVDFLLSGIFAAHQVSIVSPAVLVKIGERLIRFPKVPLGQVLSRKLAIGFNTITDYHTASMQYINLYEKMLQQPLIETKRDGLKEHIDFSETSYINNEAYKYNQESSDNFSLILEAN
jgi:starch synthase/alpha-amylase